MVKVKIDGVSRSEGADHFACFGIVHQKNTAERYIALVCGDVLALGERLPIALTDLVFPLKRNAGDCGLFGLR